MKNVRPPSKKTKGKGKSAAAEPSEVDESQVGDALSENEDNESQEDSVEVISVSSDSSPSPPKPARRICGKVPFSHPNAYLDPNFLLKKAHHTSNRKTRSHSGDLVSGLPATNKRKPNENSPPTSGDSVMSTLPPMIRVPGAQAKKRKTSGSTPVPTSEPIKESAPIQDNPDQAEPENQMDLPESPKETMDTPKPPSPLMTREDQNAVVITGTGFSKPAATVLSKHMASSSQAIPELGLSKAKLYEYENLEFKELCSGFSSRLEASYEMEKSLLRMLENKHEQDARAKSEEKYQLALAELEKLKAELKRAQADQDATIKRAEKAEARLATMQQELSGLKRHISNMTQAVFGPRAANLQEDCVLMLKAIYTLTEQLYTGSVLTVKGVMGAKEPITSIKKVLGCLSALPPQIGELTRSAARKDVLTTLSRCLAYAPEINPEEVAAGFPQLKYNGSEFVEEDYERVVKDSRLAATQLAASLDLSKYQAAYDNKNKKVNPPTFVTTSLTPRRPKNPFDLEADLASILTDEDDFAALAKCNWVLGDLQIEVSQSSQQDDPKAPTE
ncbi:hypothetical protein ZWY2020_045896 [Hordeum vulgare]|nr:hypothetical protein ZWY2020_045896 [Hordeum vulgare]